MNIFQKWKYFKLYKKLLKNNKDTLFLKYNIKVDNIYRCYTVINFPPHEQENLRQYGYQYIDNHVRKYLRDIEEFFSHLGLFEMVGVSELKQLDDYNVLIILEFKFLNSKNYGIFKRLFYLFLILLGIFGIYLIF
jgi:hypothetical protein